MRLNLNLKCLLKLSSGRLIGGKSSEFLRSLSAGCIFEWVCVCVCLLSLSLSPGQPVEATPDISTSSFKNWASVSLNEDDCAQWFALCLIKLTWKVLPFIIWHIHKHETWQHTSQPMLALDTVYMMTSHWSLYNTWIRNPPSQDQLLNLSQISPPYTPTSFSSPFLRGGVNPFRW